VKGYRRTVVADGELWVAGGFEEAADELGLAERARWESKIAEGESAGRGRIAFVDSSGGRLTLKQLRRGGLAGALWRERFLSRERLTANLSTPALARERGVSTPAAMALLLVGGPPGLWRGWLALETVPRARDMMQCVLQQTQTTAVWAEVLGVARSLHDAGIEHPDLNLGNLLFDEAGKAWVIDLDGCTVHSVALDVDRRIKAIRRIERSYLKTCFLNDLTVDPTILWPEIYAPDAAALIARWEQRSARDVAKLQRHRHSWRR
jgi:3-deoxy-D-manno-octulosonic acid kinase